MGHLASRTRAGGLAAERRFAVELAKAVGREETRVDGPDNGLFGTKRDHESGVVAADRADDDEHWTLDASGGMDRSRDGKIYQGPQGIGTGYGHGFRYPKYNISSSSVRSLLALLTPPRVV